MKQTLSSLAFEMKLISKADPLKFLITRPMLSGRLAKWSLLLSEFDICYVPQKAVKGRALADFLAAHPIEGSEAIIEDLPDEEVLVTQARSPWQMYFDGASKSTGAGIGIHCLSFSAEGSHAVFFLPRKKMYK